jgi:hypothetical protein
MIAGECNADATQLCVMFVTLRKETSLRTAHIFHLSGLSFMVFSQKLRAQPRFNSMSEK